MAQTNFGDYFVAAHAHAGLTEREKQFIWPGGHPESGLRTLKLLGASSGRWNPGCLMGWLGHTSSLFAKRKDVALRLRWTYIRLVPCLATSSRISSLLRGMVRPVPAAVLDRPTCSSIVHGHNRCTPKRGRRSRGHDKTVVGEKLPTSPKSSSQFRIAPDYDTPDPR